MSKKLDKINSIARKSGNSIIEEAKAQKQNRQWIKKSRKIAIHILSEIKRQKPNNGMSQKKLAEKMDVSPQYINKIVKGEENLTLETISRIEEVLGVELFNVDLPQSNMYVEPYKSDYQHITSPSKVQDGDRANFDNIIDFTSYNDSDDDKPSGTYG
ncbi:MAG: helix-turn-helix transcriptional regulator [Bacteroidales bacterium]|nr:helix-turn-helix transcriptional regulator [Bacteroidales bacterium]